MQDLSSQFLQLRQEVKADISGVRLEVGEVRAEVHELRADVGGLRTEVGGLREDVTGLRGEMYSIRDELRVDMASMHKDLATAIIANGDEMRALHEAAIERIKLLGEAIRPAANASPPDNSR